MSSTDNAIDFFDNFAMTIDGKKESTATSLPVINPATEQAFAQAPDCSEEQLNAAVAAARRALPGWKALPLAERAQYLRAVADRIKQFRGELTPLLTAEQGKPLGDAKGELAAAAYWFTHFATRDLPVESTTQPDGKIIDVYRVPLGVIGAIVPWNFPVSLAAWKLAPALLAGNTVVLKPSPYTPLTTLKLGELLLDVLPPGVLNVVSGGDHLGPLLSSHADVNKIAFTGSTATGKAVMRSAAGTLKRLTLELGGNDPAIVLPDVDVDDVAEKLFWGAFGNAGQVCIAAKRIYVHDDIYDRFAAKMAELARANLPANGEAPGARIGPVQNKAQYDRVKELIADARTTGAKFLVDPGEVEGAGYFIAPTIIDNPSDDSRIVREEPFGPVVPLLRFSNVDEVVARANDSEYGLACSIWSGDAAVASSIAPRIESGTVWVNAIQVVAPGIPFGGHKQSGIGVESADEGLHEYTNIQTIVR